MPAFYFGLGALLVLAVAALAAIVLAKNRPIGNSLGYDFANAKSVPNSGPSAFDTVQRQWWWRVWSDRHKTDSVDDYNGKPYLLTYDELANEFAPSDDNVGDLKVTVTAARGKHIQGDLHLDGGGVEHAVGSREGNDIVWRGENGVVQVWSAFSS
jgi:hypothetical protein